jgi:D-alanyl-D-alanine carboxypeptidase/D-alanyl-D-alanine-endopeptidase (penicillin-binding protein 4)
MVNSGRKTLILRALVLLFVFLPATPSHADVNHKKILSFLSKTAPSKRKIGIMVRSADTGKTVFRYNSKKTFIPASNNKILSSVAALSLLGKKFRFRTEFYLGGGIHSGVGHGGLYVKGFGDPTIDIDKFREIAKRFKALGITRIDGGIHLDGSYFDEARYGEGWDPEWFDKGFCPPITAISFNYNSAKIKISASRVQGGPATVRTQPAEFPFRIRNRVSTSFRKSGVRAKYNEQNELTLSGYVSYRKKAETLELSVPDPFFYFGSVLKKVLEENGIEVSGPIDRRIVPRWAGKVFTHYSEPLGTIIHEYNKESVNIIGESIVKVIGAKLIGGPGSWESGTRVIENHLRQIGLNGNFSVADGSGLSRLNRVSPEDITQALSKAYRDPDISEEFVASLPIAGVDGTLERRFRNLKGKVYAKTGYLEGARSLSGYVFGENERVYVFSIISNGMGTRVKKLQNLLLRELVY